ncbi:MAG: DUF4367 domain-containing protein [Oscillospiraceae bacterium]|nr:DUF4367 domain-containing protein [Oscillospiraceae bacterium]
MNEALFDAKLKQAFLQAAEAEFAAPLAAPAAEPAWSLPYRRRREKMLEDPNRWYHKQARPVWKKMLQQAACLLLAASVTFGALLAASPTVRAAVRSWLREFTGTAVVYRGEDAPKPVATLPEEAPAPKPHPAEEKTETPDARPTEQPDAPQSSAEAAQTAEAGQTIAEPAADETTVRVFSGENDSLDIPVTNSAAQVAAAPAWLPTWLPDGWKLKQFSHNARCVYTDQYGGTLEFTCSQSAQDSLIIAGLTEDKLQRVTVNGVGADYYESDGCTYLFWEDMDSFFSLQSGSYGSLDQANLIKIAQSVKELDAVPAYTLNWTPTGSRMVNRCEVPAGGMKEFVDGDNWYFWFTYAADSAGELYAQGSTPTRVTVGDCEGVYWAAPKKRDATYGGAVTVICDDGSEETRHLASGGQVSTLIWTNKAGVTFSIRGAFDKETLISMAGSVAAAT